MLEAGAAVNATTTEFTGDPATALIEAADFGREVAVRALLATGADIHATDGDGHTALYYWARHYEEVESVESVPAPWRAVTCLLMGL